MTDRTIFGLSILVFLLFLTGIALTSPTQRSVLIETNDGQSYTGTVRSNALVSWFGSTTTLTLTPFWPRLDCPEGMIGTQSYEQCHTQITLKNTTITSVETLVKDAK